jgi:hypothetical protein
MQIGVKAPTSPTSPTSKSGADGLQIQGGSGGNGGMSPKIGGASNAGTGQQYMPHPETHSSADCDSSEEEGKNEQVNPSPSSSDGIVLDQNGDEVEFDDMFGEKDEAQGGGGGLLDLAEAAKKEARRRIKPYKSDNKLHPGKARDRDKRDPMAYYKWKQDKQAAMARLKKSAPKRGSPMKDVIAYGDAAAREGVGNCFELSSIVCSILASQPNPPALFDVVDLAPPGDHAFVVIGQPVGEDGKYPMDFRDWNEDAIICDPWMNIHCRARDYPARWGETLQRWEEHGKQLPIPAKVGDAHKGGFQSPTNPFWLRAIEDNEKRSFTKTKPAEPSPSDDPPASFDPPLSSHNPKGKKKKKKDRCVIS